MAPLPSDLPLVLASYRGPVAFARGPDGERTSSRGAGGLVTALTGIAAGHPHTTWVCAADGPEDEAVAAEHPGEPVEAEDIRIRLVPLDAEAQRLAYTVVANPLLWFIQHGLWGSATAPVLTADDHRAYEHGYRPVNEAIADAVAEEVERAGGRALVMVQDYHLYLVPGLVRARFPDVVLTHFVHIPWPGPDAWRVLPRGMRDELITGLLGADVVAFHTEHFAREFVLCAQELLGLPVDLEALTVTVGPRTVRARHYPISVDVATFDDLAATEEVRRLAGELADQYLEDGKRLVVRVDRTDPSKNIVRGFEAFETLLRDHPEWRGQVTFLALLQPSRLDVAEYVENLRAIGGTAALVNATYAQGEWQPIDLRFAQHLPLAVAAYSVCDVLVVNSLADGMNLVAKEACLVNRRGMVLALSENTGAFAELGAFAVTLAPYDVAQQSEALDRALRMPAAERQSRLGMAEAVVRHNDVAAWLGAQLADLGLA